MTELLPPSTRMRVYGTRDEWLAGRISAIGASEVAVVLGEAPPTWGTKRSLWERKRHKIDAPLEREFLLWGSLLEPGIAQGYSTLTGTVIHSLGAYTRVYQDDSPWLCATLDYVIEPGQRPDRSGAGTLQIKHASVYARSDFDDGLPRHYWIQGQAELAASGLQWGEFAVLFGSRLEVFAIERDQRWIEGMLTEVHSFAESIERNMPPPIDGSVALSEVLQSKHPVSMEHAIELPAEYADLYTSRQQLVAEIDRLETEMREIDNRFRVAIGDAQRAVIPGCGAVTYRTSRVREHTKLVKAYSYRTLRFPRTKMEEF